jgi:hypothetical protein
MRRLATGVLFLCHPRAIIGTRRIKGCRKKLSHRPLPRRRRNSKRDWLSLDSSSDHGHDIASPESEDSLLSKAGQSLKN